MADAPRFDEIADEILALLEGAVFVAHNAAFDLAMLQASFADAGIDYGRPASHARSMRSDCSSRGAATIGSSRSASGRGSYSTEAHDALERRARDCRAPSRAPPLHEIAPETVELDHVAFMRLRSRGDTRAPRRQQIRRVFGMARSAGLNDPEGGVDRERVAALVEQVTGTANVDSLTREQVQAVFDELERLLALDVA